MKDQDLHVLFADPLTDEFENRWREALSDLQVKLTIFDQGSEDILKKNLPDADVLMIKRKKVDQDLLDKTEDLKLIIKLSHWPIWVDEDACKNKGVEVASIPQLGGIAVAEHAITLMMNCARDIIPSHRGVKQGNYRDQDLTPEVTTERSFEFKWLPVDPFEVYGKTLGIIGYGEIGKEVSQRANALGMDVVYYEIDKIPSSWEDKLNVEYRDMNELLSISDFITLHLPHTDQTEDLISRNEFKTMKSSAYLINAARGGVVDEKELVKALEDGEIAGAGLDVFEKEPLPYDHPLTEMDNVVLTPHIGGGSGEGWSDLIGRVKKKIRSVASGTH